MIYHTQTVDDWHGVAKKIIAALPVRENATVLALSGTLGAGKTTCTQAFAQALGVAERVTSPTFVLMQIYSTHHAQFDRLVHIDAYRLKDIHEAAVLRLDEYVSDPRTLIMVEWPEHLSGLLPQDKTDVAITIDGEGRTITIS